MSHGPLLEFNCTPHNLIVINILNKPALVDPCVTDISESPTTAQTPPSTMIDNLLYAFTLREENEETEKHGERIGKELQVYF